MGTAAIAGLKVATVSGGSSTSYTYATSPALSAYGLTLDQDTGAISGTPTKAYDRLLTVTVTVKNSSPLETVSKDIKLTIGKGTQTVSFGTLAQTSQVIGATYTASATATKSGTPAISVDGACAIDGNNVVTFGSAAGTCTITAAVENNADYADASATQTITVGKASQTISFTPATAPTDKKVNETLQISAASARTGASNTPGVTPTLGATGSCTINSTNLLTFKSVGDCVVTATAAASDTYASATATLTIPVSKGTQSITITSSASTPVVDGTSQVAATSKMADGTTDTGLTPQIKSSGVCTMDAKNLVTFTAVGTCTIDAAVKNATNYGDASATLNITVYKGKQTVSITSTAISPVVNGTYKVTAKSVKDGTTTDTGITPEISASGACEITDRSTQTVTFKSNGDCTITAAVSNATNYADASTTQKITVGQGTQEIVLTSQAPDSARVNTTYQIHGYVKRNGQQINDVSVTYATTTDYCTVSDQGLVTYTAKGTCTITVSLAGDNNFAAAQSTQKTTVTPLALSASILKSDVALTVGVKPTSFTPVTGSGGTGDYSYASDPSTALTDLGLTVESSTGAISASQALTKAFDGQITIKVTAGAETISAPFNLKINKGAQTITFNQLAAVTAGTTATLSASSSAGASYPVSFSIPSTSASVCEVSGTRGTSITYKAAGDCVIYADRAGDDNYGAATRVSQTVKVNAAALATSVAKSSVTLKVGETPAPFTPVTASGGTGNITYASDPQTALSDLGLTISSTTGEISASKALTKAFDGQITIKVTAGAETKSSQFNLTINKGAQTITFNPIAAVTAGTKATLAASSSAGASYPVSFSIPDSSANFCAVSGTSITYKAAGDCVIYADQAGGDNYNGATQVSQTVKVNAAALAASTQTPNVTLTVGVAPPANTQPVKATGGNGTYVYVTDPPTALTALGLTLDASTGVINANNAPTKAFPTGNITIKVSAGSETSSANFQLTINKGAQTITFNPIAAVTAGTKATLAASSSAGASYPVSFSIPDSSANFCAVSGTSITYKAAGDCVIYADRAGDDNYNGATRVSQTVKVNAVSGATLTVTPSGNIPKLRVGVAITPFKPVIATGGSGNYIYELAPGSSLPADLTLERDTGLIKGIPRVTGTIRFSIKVSDTSKVTDARPILTPQFGATLLAAIYQVAAVDPNTIPVELSVIDPTPTTISLSATPKAPVVGQKLVITATIAAKTATGTVIFQDNGKQISGPVPVSGGAATFTTAPLSSGDHSFTAVYSGDDNYATATSAPLVITPTARPNPTADKNVRAIVAAQAASAQRVAGLQLDHVMRRLETLHDDDVPAFVNGLSVSAPSGLPTGASPFDDPMLKGQGFSRSEATQALDRTLDKTFGKSSAMSADRDAPARPGRYGALEGSRFKVWTAGSVIFGGVNVSALGVETKTHFTLSGITAGVDTKLMDGVKAGFAVSYSGQSDDIGTDGSKMNSRTVTGQLYASWRMVDKLFLDGAVGYGDMTFTSKRLDANAASVISGDRRGKLLFGSLALSYDAKRGPLSFSPYARLDVIDASLNAYTESGDEAWILSYDKATMASRTMVLGLRGEYGIEQSWGLLSPTWRVEYRRLLSGDVTQTMSYATEGASSYALTTTASDHDTLSAALGLKARSKGDVTGSLEYLLSGGVRSGLQGQGVRGMLRVGF